MVDHPRVLKKAAYFIPFLIRIVVTRGKPFAHPFLYYRFPIVIRIGDVTPTLAPVIPRIQVVLHVLEIVTPGHLSSFAKEEIVPFAFLGRVSV